MERRRWSSLWEWKVGGGIEGVQVKGRERGVHSETNAHSEKRRGDGVGDMDCLAEYIKDCFALLE